MSEEGLEVPYAKRKEWETFWVVDPLDGTKEFVKRSGEFTVNIALVSKKRPYRIVGSRSHPGPELQAFIEQKRRHPESLSSREPGHS